MTKRSQIDKEIVDLCTWEWRIRMAYSRLCLDGFLGQYNFNSRITRLGNGLDCILKLLRVLFMGVFMHLLR